VLDCAVRHAGNASWETRLLRALMAGRAAEAPGVSKSCIPDAAAPPLPSTGNHKSAGGKAGGGKARLHTAYDVALVQCPIWSAFMPQARCRPSS